MTEDSTNSKRPGAVYVALAGAIALLVCLVLQFSAMGKIMGPNPDHLLIQAGVNDRFPDGLLRDYVIAGAEMLIVVLLAFLFRWRYAWSFIAILFAGLLGYSGYALINGIDCGCFGAMWTPPKGLTVGLNGAFILASFILLFLGRTNKVVIGLTALLAIGGGVAGYLQGAKDRPTTEEVIKTELGGNSPIDKTLANVPALAGVLDAEPGERLVYVFIHEEGCNVCEQFKPVVEIEHEEFEAQGVPISVVMIENTVLEDEFGIPKYAWQTTPTVFAVDGGQVVYYDRGEDIMLPSDLMDPWFAGESLGGRDANEDLGIKE